VVLAHFTDGSIRDVTPITVYSSSAPNQSATWGDNGVVEKVARGETAILARYLDKMATSYITFLEDVPGFAWNNAPERISSTRSSMPSSSSCRFLPSDLCSDEEFLRRRMSTRRAGCPPSKNRRPIWRPRTRTSADQFGRCARRIRRLRLVLDADDRRYSAVERQKLNPTGVQKFRLWLYESVRSDKPLNQFARELLTASGSAYANPAANYWRASRDPQDATETTAQLFLGIRIQCAKCHNHPFERWTQDNYYGIGAAFVRIGRKAGSTADEEVVFVSKRVKSPSRAPASR